jgi:beta-alanine--pyruvate transaminase
VSNRLNVAPNDLRLLDAVHREPAVQEGAAPVRQRQGHALHTVDGRKVLDGTAGLWCVNAGHCRPKIVEAIQQQAAELDYAPGLPDGPSQGLRTGQPRWSPSRPRA